MSRLAVVLAVIFLARPAIAQECACLSQPVLPVALRVASNIASAGWLIEIRTPVCRVFTDYLVRFDDRPEESLGHAEELDMMTARPMARSSMIVPEKLITPGDHKVQVRMIRRDGTVDGPHTLSFNREAVILADAKSRIEEMRNNLISFAEHQEEHTFLMFSALDQPESVREILYSVDDCSLRERAVAGSAADPAKPDQVTAERPYLVLPQSTRLACAQVIFRDGTRSRVFEVPRKPRG